MRKVLIVVDMQNDFITGSLGTKEAVSILPNVKKKIEEFDGLVLYTRDTHTKDYLNTQEGRNLPVVHCIKDTWGWQIEDSLKPLCKTEPINKETFGSSKLGDILVKLDQQEKIESITLIGLCTDICVISNAFIAKAFLPEVEIIVDSNCCAGVTPESHERSLQSMKTCQITII